jgi:2-polyprenyl-3-methyl-5-hydroxy-6-metoxy-1,4-benzoquinol methylase
MQPTSEISKNIEAYATDVYLNQALVQNNRVEDLMDICSLELLLEIAGLVQHPDPILEMGYGTGLMLRELTQRHGLRIDLVEGSAALCEQARRLYGSTGIEVFNSYFETFSGTKKYDHILAMHVLEHVDDPVQVVRQMALALNPGGRVVMLVPNAHSLHRRLAVHMGLQESLHSLSPRDQLVGHQRVFDPGSLHSCATDAGLDVERSFGFGLKTLPYSMMEGWTDELIRACVKVSAEVPAALLGNIGLIACKPA